MRVPDIGAQLQNLGMAMLVTLSFLVTTPNQGPDAQGFLIKDFFLLGAAIWSAGEALQASMLTSKP